MEELWIEHFNTLPFGACPAAFTFKPKNLIFSVDKLG